MRLWLAIAATVIAAVLIFGAVIAVRQVNHDNGCALYGHELGAAVDDPAHPAFNGLPPDLTKTARQSDTAFENAGGNDGGATTTNWQWYAQGFVDDAMALHGC